jgi:hypothetical protein
MSKKDRKEAQRDDITMVEEEKIQRGNPKRKSELYEIRESRQD